MDWTKAKTILIIALIVTDIFLIYMCDFTQRDGAVEKEDAALVGLLEKKNIYLEIEMPKRYDELAVLSVEYRNVDEADKEALLRAQNPFAGKGTDKNYEEAAIEFITYLGMMSENAVLDKVEKVDEEAIVSFKNAVKKFPVENSYMRCIFREKTVVDFEYLWFEADKFSAKQSSAISPAKALLTFMMEKDDTEKITVEDMKMVYYIGDSYSQTAVSDTALPCWKITYNGGIVEYISAFER